MPGRVESDDVSSNHANERRDALQLLRERGADAIEHVRGTLLEHLERTEGLLLAWGSTTALATAGLCHAAYGTDGFARVLLGLDERHVLISAIGSDAEAIVYFYASCDRGFLYPQIGASDPVNFRDRFTHVISSPSRRQLREFADLTLANETDVVGGVATSSGVPEWFVSLVHRFAPLASPEVANACERLVANTEQRRLDVGESRSASP